MVTLIQEGGFPMWFVLLFGFVTLGCSIAYAIRLERRLLGLARGMAIATLFSTLSGTAANFGQVFHVLAGKHDPALKLSSPDGPLILLLGLGESMSTSIIGFAFLALAGLFYGVGAMRSGNA